MNQPYEIRFDKSGNMFFVEMQNHVVRRVDVKTRLISTVAGTGGVAQFRMTYWLEGSGRFDGEVIVLAIPMTDVLSVLRQLLVIEALIGAGVLLGTAVIGLAIIEIGLRPLRRMGAVAGTIAAAHLEGGRSDLARDHGVAHGVAALDRQGDLYGRPAASIGERAAHLGRVFYRRVDR